jgi:DNA-binding XRE family transcriptional regulator
MKTSEQMQKIKTQPGFIAALDQSGGSTPHALALYGIKDHAWKDDDEMFELVHQMRTRLITSPGFTGERILGVIQAEGNTMSKSRLCNRLKVARAEKNLSQEQLGLLAGVTRQTISSIETGQYNPSALLALLLARRLDKRVEDLFYLEEEKP